MYVRKDHIPTCFSQRLIDYYKSNNKKRSDLPSLYIFNIWFFWRIHLLWMYIACWYYLKNCRNWYKKGALIYVNNASASSSLNKLSMITVSMDIIHLECYNFSNYCKHGLNQTSIHSMFYVVENNISVLFGSLEYF